MKYDLQKQSDKKPLPKKLKPFSTSVSWIFPPHGFDIRTSFPRPKPFVTIVICLKMNLEHFQNFKQSPGKGTSMFTWSWIPKIISQSSSHLCPIINLLYYTHWPHIYPMLGRVETNSIIISEWVIHWYNILLFIRKLSF